MFPWPTISLRGKVIEFRRPWVMGIINVTPDSFYESSRTLVVEDVLKRASAMLKVGVNILDIGACSTRPGSVSIGEEEEMARLQPPLRALKHYFPNAIISVDTFRVTVAEECLRRGQADIINDISGGADLSMFKIIEKYGGAYVLMHMRGTPANMDNRCQYGTDVVADVVKELAFKLAIAREAGIANVIIDPGFGFAKTTEQNLRILDRLDELRVLGCPVLAGISRKRMVREACGCDIKDSLTATVALNSIAIMKGASIIRVHDGKEGVLTAKTIGSLWTV